MKDNKNLIVGHLGKMDYGKAWDFQSELFKENVDIKLKNRQLELDGQAATKSTKNYFFLCEHPHVYTLGKSGNMENLLINNATLKEKNIAFYKSNRGGDITYHGPGQVVGYPILDLDNFSTDIHVYMRNLEEVIILTLREYGIYAGRIPKLTGVWLDFEKMQNPRKICAMGVKMSRWVTMHGFALNVNTDLEYFNNIVPCGIEGKAVTSIQAELGKEVAIKEVEKKLIKHFIDIFEIENFEFQNSGQLN